MARHHIVVAWARRGGELIYVQPTIKEMTGWTVREVLTRPSPGIIPSDQITDQRLTLPGVYTGKQKITCKDGTTISICSCVVTLSGDVTVGFFRQSCPHLEQLAGKWDRLAEKNKIWLLDLASILAR